MRRIGRSAVDLWRIARGLFPGRTDQERHRFEFRIGDVFDPNSRMARYVMRLSLALGDLRIAAATYAVRQDQSAHERLYFVRLTAAHLHEVSILFNPPDKAIPGIEEFISAVVAPSDAATAADLRRAHKAVQKRLQIPVAVPGKPNLAAELSRLRNEFLHYANKSAYEPPLVEAMTLAASIHSAYVIREHTMRAEYADEVAGKLMHPWQGLSDREWTEAVRALHSQIVALIEPVAAFLQEAEAAYLGSQPHGIVRRIDR